MGELVPVVVRKLCDEFRKLPLIVDDEAVLREQAQLLAMAVETSRANHRASHRYVGTRNAVKVLQVLADDLAFAAKGLGELPAEAEKRLTEVSGGYAKLSEFQRQIINLQRIVVYAAGSLEGGTPTKPSTGAREKKIAKDITRWTAAIYVSLTGLKVARRSRPSDLADNNKEAGPYGPLHDLLIAVFSVFDVKAKPDSMIKSLMEKTRSVR